MNSTDPRLNPADSPPLLSAPELLAEWKQAIEERDKVVSRRLDNMFYGPMGIEERVAFLENDNRMNAWFLNKLIQIACDLESKMPKEENRPPLPAIDHATDPC